MGIGQQTFEPGVEGGRGDPAVSGPHEAGRDYNTAELSDVTLFNVVLPPFKAAIDEAHVASVMNAFNTLNGVPATGDAFLQRDVLKGAWNYQGLVVSDWGSALEMIAHGFAADERHAAELAIRAGSDVDMESRVYPRHLVDLVEAGVVDIEDVDDAVRRVLRFKFALGLFDDPYRYLDADRERDHRTQAHHRAAARHIAERSIVLLKNTGDLLPLKPGRRIALIGALAGDKTAPLGNWRAQANAGSAISVVEGFEAAGLDFDYTLGAQVEIGEAGFGEPVIVNADDHSGFDAARAAAQNADIAVIILGEAARQSGEGRSRARLDLPGVQQELLEAVRAANPNTVLVVMSGRPLVLTWADAHVPAIIQAWHLGHESGHAITNVLTGRCNPSGKLPMTFPRSAGQVPIFYNHLSTGRPGPSDTVFWSHYNDEANAPLYPFGHGLSYTQFAYANLRMAEFDDGFVVSVDLTNIGLIAGEEAAQLYLRDRVARICRPVRELKGFHKITLEPGQTETIEFHLGAAELGYCNARGAFVLEPGAFDVFVGGSSTADLQITLDLCTAKAADLREV